MLLAILFACGHSSPVVASEIEFGTILVCDSQQQAEAVAERARGGAEMTEAVAAVNDAFHSRNACGPAELFYLRGDAPAVFTNSHQKFEVAKVLVLGDVNYQWLPSFYYAVIDTYERRA